MCLEEAKSRIALGMCEKGGVREREGEQEEETGTCRKGG